MKRHVNIPIFIPHLGCPNQCVFCNQRSISGVQRFDIGGVRTIIDDSLKTIKDGTSCEIAFFGGSFTGIDRSLMTQLLEISHEYILAGKVDSIRCSTRPDYIDDDILDILSQYGVSTIELGLQSISDSVLIETKRGHTAQCAKEATELIVSRGFDLVGQMMIGLPGSSTDDELETAQFIIDSGAKAARIYPTVVFYDTPLSNMVGDTYTPLSLDDAVSRSCAVFERLVGAGIEVIRIGLCSSDNLFDSEKYHAGPNHPALGEMVINRFYYNKIKSILLTRGNLSGANISIQVPKGSLSRVIGQKRVNKTKLISEFGLADIKFIESSVLTEYELIID